MFMKSDPTGVVLQKKLFRNEQRGVSKNFHMTEKSFVADHYSNVETSHGFVRNLEAADMIVFWVHSVGSCRRFSLDTVAFGATQLHLDIRIGPSSGTGVKKR